MNVMYTGKARRTLEAKMAELRGPGAKIAADGIARAIEAGNTRDRLAGKDRYGKSLAPIKGKRPDGATGPPLAPHGASSRSISTFRADARRRGGSWVIIAGWIGAVSKKGTGFLPFHFQGRGRLPVRDLAGISPQTWVDIRKVIEAFKARVARAKG